MIQTPEERAKQLEEMSQCLKTASGEILMEDLEILWNPYNLIGGTAEETAYLVGLRDAYKHLKHIQGGKFDA